MSKEDTKDDDGSRAFTPFGVLVGPAGALKSFDDESFYNEVLLPAEKEQLKKNKEDFLKDPEAKHTVQEGFHFIPWGSSVIKSNGRNALAFERILSNTWALNKEAIPAFVDLLEKLRQKYSTVLGDDKLLQHLEAAQHRARELEVGEDIPEASTSSTSSRWVRNSKRKIQSGFSEDDLRSQLNQYVNLDWDTLDPQSSEFQSLESQLYESLRLAGYGPDAAEDILLRVSENPVFIDELLTNLPEDDDDSGFDYPASWGEGNHPFKRVGSPPRFSSRRIHSAVGLDKYIYDFNDRPTYLRDMIDDLGTSGSLRVGSYWYNPSNQGMYYSPREGARQQFRILDPAGGSVFLDINKKAYDYAVSKGAQVVVEQPLTDDRSPDELREAMRQYQEGEDPNEQWTQNQDDPEKWNKTYKWMQEDLFKDVGSSRRIRSAAEGVDPQAYDNYIQQLIQKGIPEDQARQMADNLVAQLQQDMAQFATNIQKPAQQQNNSTGLVSSLNINGGRKMAKLIKSEGDVIVNQDDEDTKDKDEEGSEGTDLGGDDAGGSEDLDFGGEDESLDFGSPEEGDEVTDVEDGFMDEVNSIDEFGANSPSISKEEVVDAVEAISQIVDTILEVEGGEEGNLTSEETGYTLDAVDDLAAGYDTESPDAEGDLPALEAPAGGAEPMGEFDEGGFDEDLDEELPEDISASLVRVIEVGKPIKSKFNRLFASHEDFMSEPALICKGINSSMKITEVEPAQDAVYETLVVSHVVPKDDTPIQIGFMKVGSIKDWVKQSKGHKISWRIASNHLKNLIKHAPASPREKAAVMALANSYYRKWFEKGDKLSGVFSGRSVRNIRRVGMALQHRLSSGKSLHVVRSDYNGYRNYETWNAATYINNDLAIKNKARNFVQSKGGDYDQFIASYGMGNTSTPDGVKWADSKIDRGQMKEVLESLRSSYKSKKGIIMSETIANPTQADRQDEVVTVQDDTSTGIDLSGKTLSSPEIEDPNSEKVVKVDGGDTSEYADVHNTGDDGSLEADIKAGTEVSESEYGFDSQEMVGIELPIEEENSTQVLELKSIGSGVYVLNRAYVSPGAGRVSFLKGNDARKLVANNTRPASIKANVDRLLTLKDSKNGLLLRSSNVLGVIAIEAPFQKGLKNAKYSVFSRKGVNLINEDGYYITSNKGPQKMIASAVSNKSFRVGKEKIDIFSDIERDYIKYLQSQIVRLVKANANLRAKYSNAVTSHKKREQLYSNIVRNTNNRARSQIASAVESLDSLRTETAQAEAQRAVGGTQEAILSAAKAEKEQNQRNIDYLASLYM